MSPQKLLIISYVFPPFGGIPVQRALNFAKYLPETGLEVHVVTASNAAAPVRDPGLLRHIPPGVRVHRIPTPEPPFYLRKKAWGLLAGKGGVAPPAAERKPESGAQRSWKSRAAARVKSVLMPDPQVLWKPCAVWQASRVIRRYGIDTVLVTAPPFSVFLTGNELKRRFPQIRLVSDFRDEWLRFYLTDFDFLAGDETRRRAEAIERETIERSDLVLAVTQSSLGEIRGRYPAEPDRKFALLPNGYDPATFQALATRPHGRPGGMVVTHIGTAYRTASPVYYLDALDTLPDAVRTQIETRFIGRVAETEQDALDGRRSPVRQLGFLPQAEAVRYMEETDYLLLTMTNDFSLPGKLFEYMASGKRILALSPRGGEVDRILRATGAGECVPHDDPAAIRELLLRAWERRAEPTAMHEPDWQAIRRYERPRLARDLATLLAERLG
jgi:hypothetical protein